MTTGNHGMTYSTIRCCVMAGVLALAQSVSAAEIIPDSGAYWDVRRNGEGVFIEVQGGKVSMMMFTHDAEGRQAFYTSGGDLISHHPGEQAIIGLYPHHIYRGDLYQTHNGPIFNGSDASAGQTGFVKVGRVEVWFSKVRALIMIVRLDPPVPAGVFREKIYVMSRLNFGFEQYGRSITSGYEEACWTDLRGEWVFVDRTDPDRPPWRFHFSTLEIVPEPDEITCRQPATAQPQVLTYRDPHRAATMRCVYASLQLPDPVDGQAKIACDVRIDGEAEALFWFHVDDAGLKRISASLGSREPYSILRTTDRVVGWRVE
jgi:hypothetical protein